MTTRQPHDPFTDAPLRPTTSNVTSLSANTAALRTQTSAHSLRSNTSTSSARTRQQRGGDLFAPSLSRRPASRTTPRVEDEVVLADSDSEQDLAAAHAAQRQRQLRRIRHGSPEGKHSRLNKKQDEEMMDFVNRRPDGSYLLGVTGFGEGSAVVPMMSVPRTEEEVEQERIDMQHTAIARQFFTSGAALGGRSSKKHEEDLEQLRLPMMLRLREHVKQQLDDERWQYEPTDMAPNGVL